MGESALTSRDRILALVVQQPGLHLRELPRRLGISLRAVRYNLDALADEDLVVSQRSGRFERWFSAGSFSSEERELISALRVRGQRAILTVLLHGGASRFVELQAQTGLSSATVAHYLDRLVESGLVELAADRSYRLRDADATRMRLTLYRERFPDLLADAAQELFEETR
ncbi:MAG: winged helix-turn-helix transcriptional regulator [Thermoplasmata archaeon]|nr:winged helix-turn-helix transcriptional regulator [Thermoplasmata archaeon]